MFVDVRAVLFELDGTLIDSALDLGAARNQTRVGAACARCHDLPPSPVPVKGRKSGIKRLIDLAVG
jgi:phosphoglycolate phosphatase-like HAD superfamily hydrolase